MKKNNLKRFLASLLAVLMLASVTGVSPAVFAAGADPVLKAGVQEVLLKPSMSADEVRQELANQLLENPGEVDAQSLDWTYTCAVKGNYTVAKVPAETKEAREANVSVFGETYTDPNYVYGHFIKDLTAEATYTYPALKDNADGTYTLQLNGQSIQVKKVAKLTSSIEKKADSISVPLTYLDATTIDYSVLDADVFEAAVAGSTPDLTVNDVTVSYWARSKTSADEQWMPLAGGKGDWNNIPLTYPAVGEGTYKVKIEYPANDRYYTSNIELNVTFTGREASDITFKESPTVKIQYNDDLSIKLEELKAAIWENVVDSTTPTDLSTANVSIKYYAKAESGSAGDWGREWVDLNGEKVGLLTYPAISEGPWKLRFEFAGNTNYNGFSEEVEVTFTGRDPAFELIKGVTEIDAKFADAKNLETEAIANEIRNVLVKKVATDESIKLSDVKVEYKTSRIGSYKDLDKNASLDADDIGDTIHLRLSWGDGKGTAQYKPFSEEVTVKMVDNRIPSVVALVDVANITYNMDASKMIEEIIKNAIDSANSTLPADYKASDFTVELKKVTTIGVGDLTTDIVTWVPIAGDDGPNLNAGDNQTIRVTFNGSKDYKPSASVEGTLNVAKANVKVNVKKLITMHAGDADLPEGSITLDPNDPKIDIYTIFAGVTSKIGGKVTTSVYLDLPDRFTNETFLKIADPIFKGIYGKTLTEIMNDGITVGQLKELAAKLEGAADTLGKIGFDVESFKQVMSLIANLPSIVDDMTIAIGTPNHAGIYQAFAVTNSINYNTAFGTGTVLVLKNFTGVEIVKSNKLDDGKLTAKEAQDIHDGNDQLCTLQKDSKNLNNAAQKALHYRFTGINGGKLYSSHDMPVDPGKYIVTVSVRGGDFYAFPKTFTFTIVADPTPEVTPET